ncbi:MAG: PhzF family phenazine biosynthesis protein [Dehalobacterium sp.]
MIERWDDMPLTYYLVDVFAEAKYQGNQLAVFRNAGSLTSCEMQKIAKEINFSETTFIMSETKINNGYEVKIFTPDVEIPFAGHPTLGTAFILQQEIKQEPSPCIILNLGVGQIPVTFTKDQELWMRQNQPTFGPRVNPEIIADILTLNREDINPNFPVQEVSTGLPALIVPLKSLAGVRKCQVNHAGFKNFIKQYFSANILVFCPETYDQKNDLHVRVFCDDSGFPEDPATGSANGCLAGYLLEYNYFEKKRIQYQVEQGYEIGRPSLLKVKAAQEGNHFDINVGGKVFLVARGIWE